MSRGLWGPWTHPDLTSTTPRREMRLRTAIVLLTLAALLAAIAAACVPVEESHEVPTSSGVRAGSAAPVLAAEGDPRAAQRAARASRSRLTAAVRDEHLRRQHVRPAARRGAVEPRSAFEVWRTSWAARAVVRCESLNDGSWAWHHGRYRGYWQIGPNEWRDWGGLRYARSPELASRLDQDRVAYTGYRARGWQPWTCARIVGIYP